MIFKKREWETDENWSILPGTDKRMYENFDYVAESDFNPDMIFLYGHDAYDEGMKNGLAIAGIVATAAGAIYAAGKTVYRKIKNRKKKSVSQAEEVPE